MNSVPGVPENNSIKKTCICMRPKYVVICLNCGNIFRGRIRYTCPEHPNVVYMHDYRNCPKCQMLNLMQEITI